MDRDFSERGGGGRVEGGSGVVPHRLINPSNDADHGDRIDDLIRDTVHPRDGHDETGEREDHLK